MHADIQTAEDHSAAAFIVELMRGLVGCLAARPDISHERQIFYAQALGFCVRAFQPRDMLELTAAEHCLTAHHAMNDVAYDMLHERDKKPRDKMHRQVNAAGRISLNCRREFERLRRRGPRELVLPFNFHAASDAAGSAVPYQNQSEWDPAAALASFPGVDFNASPDEMMAAVRDLAARFAPTMAAEAVEAPNAPEPPVTPRPPAAPEPSATPQPMNRQQRRFAERLARKEARRAVRAV